MLLAILAAGAVMSGEAQTINNDDWVNRPTGSDILSVWPKEAFARRIDGHVVLTCRVDARGLAEECRVASETPDDAGFGKAALLLRPSFVLKPAMGPHGPISAMMSIPIDFKAEDKDQFVGFRPIRGAPEMREVTMLDHPVWARAAGFAEVARAYPARGGGEEGYAVAHCRVERSGSLSDCEPRKESPPDHGFGAAAVALADRFRVQIDPAAIPHGPPLWVDIPIRLPPPRGAIDRSVTAATWLAGFDPARAVKLFPPEAVAKGLKTGRGVARCVVAPDGALTDCTPAPGDPDGVGFSEAAVKLAASMRMNPWTADGGPVDGAVIRLPIRFNLVSRK